jgi:hypothetical protein
VPVQRPPYASLAALLDRELDLGEDPGTLELVSRLRRARRRGRLGRAAFVAMCRWKSPRASRQYARNSPARVRAALAAAFRQRDEGRRLEILTGLAGVSVPVASAILTLLDPRRYGVLDIRVWQLLFALNAVDRRPSGRGFTVGDWLVYLAALRREAARLGAPVRAVEYSLFKCHRRWQAGRLYDPVASPGERADGRRRPARPSQPARSAREPGDGRPRRACYAGAAPAAVHAVTRREGGQQR